MLVHNITSTKVTNALLEVTHEFIDQGLSEVFNKESSEYGQLHLSIYDDGRRRRNLQERLEESTTDYAPFGTVDFSATVSFLSNDDVPAIQALDSIIKDLFQGKNKNAYIKLLENNSSEHGAVFKVTEHIIFAFPNEPRVISGVTKRNNISQLSIRTPYMVATIVTLSVLGVLFVVIFLVLKRKEIKRRLNDYTFKCVH